MSATFKGSYWDNEGKYQQEYDAAWKTLIPSSGEAEDGLPEALRAISRIGYDYYNNGFCNLWQRWEEFDGEDHYDEYEMDSYYEGLVDYLRDHTPHNLHKEFRGWLQTTQGYCNWGNGGEDVIDRIISHIIEQIIEQELIETETLTA
tara:strand:- start:1021 stop:1461 length:441 start_codon:yes stop_codon:yes gene_type:complete